MLLSSIIIVLREMLEAAFIISILLLLSRLLGLSRRWISAALVAGLLGALAYSLYIGEISEWFDYVGQEVVNALLQLGIFFALLALSFSLLRQKTSGTISMALPLAMGAIVALAITREGSEILIYNSGLLNSPQHSSPVLMGGCIGAGIGLSIGALFFYGLANISTPVLTPVIFILLSLIGGNMVSQSILLLIQADWLHAGGWLWDSSKWLPENSLLGELLYALIGYESTPSLAQAMGYLGGFMVLLGLFFAKGRSARLIRSRAEL